MILGFRRNEIFLRFVVLALPLLIISAAAARVWHVKADSPPGGIGSLEHPFFRIQAAADTAVAGDTVLVYAGTYYETVIPMHAGLDSTDGAIYYVYYIAAGDGPAIIKAQQSLGFRLGESYGFGQVIRRDYIWIEGFYITNGYGDQMVPHGAGIRTYSNYGVFIHNKIYDNDSGIYCEGSGTFAESGNNRGNYIAHNIISNSGEAAVRIKYSSENDVVFNLMYYNGYRIEPSAAVTFYCGIGNRAFSKSLLGKWGGAIPAA